MDQTDRPDFKKLKYTPHHLGAEEVEVAQGRLGRQQAGMVGLGGSEGGGQGCWHGAGPGLGAGTEERTETVASVRPEQLLPARPPWRLWMVFLQVSLLGFSPIPPSIRTLS